MNVFLSVSFFLRKMFFLSMIALYICAAQF